MSCSVGCFLRFLWSSICAHPPQWSCPTLLPKRASPNGDPGLLEALVGGLKRVGMSGEGVPSARWLHSLEHRVLLCLSGSPQTAVQGGAAHWRVLHQNLGPKHSQRILFGIFQVKKCTLPLVWPVEVMMSSWFYLALDVGTHHEDSPCGRWLETTHGSVTKELVRRIRIQHLNGLRHSLAKYQKQLELSFTSQSLKICHWTVTIIIYCHIKHGTTLLSFHGFQLCHPGVNLASPHLHFIGSGLLSLFPCLFLGCALLLHLSTEWKDCAKTMLHPLWMLEVLKIVEWHPLTCLDILEHLGNSPLTVYRWQDVGFLLLWQGGHLDGRISKLNDFLEANFVFQLFSSLTTASLHDSGPELFLPTYLPICLHTVPGPG